MEVLLVSLSMYLSKEEKIKLIDKYNNIDQSEHNNKFNKILLFLILLLVFIVLIYILKFI